MAAFKQPEYSYYEDGFIGDSGRPQPPGRGVLAPNWTPGSEC
jgi:hypothetical protein